MIRMGTSSRWIHEGFAARMNKRLYVLETANYCNGELEEAAL